MKVLLTGYEGYIGSVVLPLLVEQGHEVIGLDAGFFREPPIQELPGGALETRTGDVRHLREADLEGVDAVVHMAEISNDPMGEINPQITYEVNHRGTLRLATTAKQAGVSRFVHMSSCSVYGIAEGGDVDEGTTPNPQTTYAECKQLVERDVGQLANASFCPTFLRNATAFGVSPRLRFDLVVNNLSGLAWTTGQIRMLSDGTPWRPLVHIRDIGQAILRVLDAPEDRVRGAILNVGDSDQNYRIREVAETVQAVFPDCEITFGDLGGDTRSYRVRFERIQQVLPGFKCQWNVRRGVEELHELFSRVSLTEEMFLSRRFTRMKQLRHLLDDGVIDEHFYFKQTPHEREEATR